MRRQVLLALLGAGVFAVFALSVRPVGVLEVVDADASRVVLVAVVRDGEAVTLRYRHSLYGGLVWEVLRVRESGLVLEELEAEREAALEYYQVNRKVVRKNGLFRVEGVSLPVGDLYVRATGLGERTLILQGRELPLAGSGREGHRIQIRVRRRPFVWALLARLIQGTLATFPGTILHGGGIVRGKNWGEQGWWRPPASILVRGPGRGGSLHGGACERRGADPQIRRRA